MWYSKVLRGVIVCRVRELLERRICINCLTENPEKPFSFCHVCLVLNTTKSLRLVIFASSYIWVDVGVGLDGGGGTGPDWIRGDLDGGPAGSLGVVTGFRDGGSEVVVYWKTSHRRINHRWGYKFDVTIVGHREELRVGDRVERGESLLV